VETLNGQRKFPIQAAIVAAAVALSWTILSWTFLIVGHPEGTPTPRLDALQTAALLPGIVGLRVVEVLRPVVGQAGAFLIANLSVTGVAAFAGLVGGTAFRRHAKLRAKHSAL
jgi:hypothetical protein